MPRRKKVVPATTLDVIAKRSMRRRIWLKQGIATCLSITFPAFGKDVIPAIAVSSNSTGISISALSALVDVLIPADEFTPSASALGVGNILLEQADSDAEFRPWLAAGMKWLDQGVPGSFILREESTRVVLLERLAGSAIGSQARTFFEILRLRTMTAYYADPRSWVGLAIDRPPQPLGYRDFADPE
jgi:hypothetical protein